MQYTCLIQRSDVYMVILPPWIQYLTARDKLYQAATKLLCPVVFFIVISNYLVGQVLFPLPQLHDSGGHTASGAQLITLNALRAPAKAQQALDKALKAILHHESEGAEKQLERALAIYPDYAIALTLRAILNMKTDVLTATTDLEHAIRVDPAYGAAYAVLASVYNDTQHPTNALVNARKALQLLPEAWPVHYEMARALFCLNRNEEALKEVNQALTRMSGDAVAGAGSRATVHYLRGIILIAQGEFSEARRELERTVTEEPAGALAQPSSQLLAQLSSNEHR